MVNLSRFGLGGGEIILILAMMMILAGAKWLPNIAGRLGRGLMDGLFEFRKASREVAEDLDKEAFDTGRNLGGICGSPATQAVTPDNQVAELYRPAAFGEQPFDYRRYTNRWRSLARMIARMRRLLCGFLK